MADNEGYGLDDAGTTYQFRVTGVETYSFDNAPIAKIFGDEGVVRLNLITCRGEWDSTAANYNERLVVYTELVNSGQ